MLAQAVQEATKRAAFWGGFFWIAAIVLVALLAIAILIWIRRRVRARFEAESGTFSLDELRRLLDRGDLTVEEYEVLRLKALEQHFERSSGGRAY